MGWISFLLIVIGGTFLTAAFNKLLENKRKEINKIEEADKDLINEALAHKQED